MENIALLSKNIAEMNVQIDKQYQQQQVILKYIEGIIRDDSSGKKVVEMKGAQLTVVSSRKWKCPCSMELTLIRGYFWSIDTSRYITCPT